MKKTTRFSTLLLGILLILSMIPFAGFATDTGLEMVNAANVGLTLQNPDAPNSATNPYLINSVEDWILLSTIEEYTGTEYFLQTADLDFSSFTYEADAEEYNLEFMLGSNGCYFHATYDGNGHTISGFDAKGAVYLGLFQYIQGATIKNLTVDDCNFYTTGGNKYVGGLVGCALGKTTAEDVTALDQENWIENVVVTNTVNLESGGENGKGGRFGGIVGDGAMSKGAYNHKLTIRNCVSSVNLKVNQGAQLFFGGICGISSNTQVNSDTSTRSAQILIENCVSYATANVMLDGATGAIVYMGGILGEANGELNTVRNCYADVDFFVTKTSADNLDTKLTMGIGGIIGGSNRGKGVAKNQTTNVENCYANLKVTNATDVVTGLVIGRNKGANLNLANITYTEDTTRGVIGACEEGTNLTQNNVVAATAADVKKAGTKMLVENISLIDVKEGASVKINANADIRYDAVINKGALNALKAILGDSVTVTAKGMILAPTATVEGATAFTKEALAAGSYKDVAYNEATSGWFKNEENHIWAVTDTIAAADADKAYSARGYVTVSYKLEGDTEATVVTSYSIYDADAHSRSVKTLASAAYADEALGYSDAQKAIFKTLAGIQ